MQAEAISPLLIRKYNQPIPRYTSYPTVPYWNDEISKEEWEESFIEQYHKENAENGISLYIHLPFCESLCTYCGCNKKITTNHNVEETYLLAIEKEWSLYRKLMKQTPVIRELHLGGGTPTFFAPVNLKRLLTAILKNCIVHPQHSFSIEGHPNNTTIQHLKVLHNLGFKRISYGVQDLDEKVQLVINRKQPFEKVQQVTETARHIGFTSVNFDLIYGLPLQTTASISNTINQVLTLRPDRIAFYSYAHVPWTSKAQRLFDGTHLPSAEEKIQLYVTGRNLLLDAGYVDIGMDHFALPEDELCIASVSGKLHRNFMGYTTQTSTFLLGLGVSSISDTGVSFAQNHKTLHNYYEAIDNNNLAVKKGYFLTEEDRVYKSYILDICCKGKVTFVNSCKAALEAYSFPLLRKFAEDELVIFDQDKLFVTPIGRYFLRNISCAFDLKLQRNAHQKLEPSFFSKAI
jgi:oxygen-independent coproporphyrinogen-3 oxidase